MMQQIFLEFLVPCASHVVMFSMWLGYVRSRLEHNCIDPSEGWSWVVGRVMLELIRRSGDSRPKSYGFLQSPQSLSLAAPTNITSNIV